MATPTNLMDCTPEELRAFVEGLGEPPYRARQLLGWLYARGARGFAEMTDLPVALRRRLEAEASLGTLGLVRRQAAADGTEKFLFTLDDGKQIESVLIPEAERLTACISTQAGCALDCTFCLTGVAGFSRNLRAWEIVGQVLALAAAAGPRRLSNIVLMGMGEPLANARQTFRALEVLLCPQGLAFPPRRITLSTVGLVPEMAALGAAGYGVNLAVSLSAPTDALRDGLMPINRRYPLAELMRACRAYPLKPRQRITFEYVMLDGVNDTPELARTLVRLVAGLRCKVNLIPLNPAPELPFRPSPRPRVEAFQRVLKAARVMATIRESRGQEIFAACGMLSLREVPAPPEAGDRGPAAGEDHRSQPPTPNTRRAPLVPGR
jgi:23S rRNA (adenine2503-C2)-methyltransferase